MIEWELEADDIYTGVMVVDLATPLLASAERRTSRRMHQCSQRVELKAIRALDDPSTG